MTKYRKFLSSKIAEMESPYYENLLTNVEADAWIRFAAGSLASGDSIGESAEYADKMMEKFRQRFMTEVPDDA